MNVIFVIDKRKGIRVHPRNSSGVCHHNFYPRSDVGVSVITIARIKASKSTGKDETMIRVGGGSWYTTVPFQNPRLARGPCPWFVTRPRVYDAPLLIAFWSPFLFTTTICPVSSPLVVPLPVHSAGRRDGPPDGDRDEEAEGECRAAGEGPPRRPPQVVPRSPESLSFPSRHGAGARLFLRPMVLPQLVGERGMGLSPGAQGPRGAPFSGLKMQRRLHTQNVLNWRRGFNGLPPNGKKHVPEIGDPCLCFCPCILECSPIAILHPSIETGEDILFISPIPDEIAPNENQVLSSQKPQPPPPRGYHGTQLPLGGWVPYGLTHSPESSKEILRHTHMRPDGGQSPPAGHRGGGPQPPRRPGHPQV